MFFDSRHFYITMKYYWGAKTWHVLFTFCHHKNTRIQVWKKLIHYIGESLRFVQNFELKKCPINKTSKYMRWIKVILVLPFQFCQHFIRDRIMSPLVGWNRCINLTQNVWSSISQSVIFFWPLEWISSWCSSILHAGHTYTITTYLYSYESIC